MSSALLHHGSSSVQWQQLNPVCSILNRCRPSFIEPPSSPCPPNRSTISPTPEVKCQPQGTLPPRSATPAPAEECLLLRGQSFTFTGTLLQAPSCNHSDSSLCFLSPGDESASLQVLPLGYLSVLFILSVTWLPISHLVNNSLC